jgi:hypothetical protein
MAKKKKEPEISLDNYPHPVKTKNAVYFYMNRYKPKYFLGDPVKGVYRGEPWKGTVANDTLISEEEGPYILVFLDKPIMVDNEERTMLKLKHDEVKESK